MRQPDGSSGKGMRLSRYVDRDGKRLRCGYTTGACAAAAAKAAATLLLTGETPARVALTVPAGATLMLEVAQAAAEEGWARCAVRKDSGDDPDVTHGVWVYATVSRIPSGIAIDGGEGVGRVTKPGLDQPIGNAAINSVPRRMIEQAVLEVARACAYDGGLSVVISIPAGVALAARTFNPRLGIEGGISVIGTTGIVEPMSDAAIVETIRAELSVRRAGGGTHAILAPGNYGEAFLRAHFGIAETSVIQCSNFIGDAVEMASGQGFSGLLLVGHLGKLVKLAGGMLNTHSRYGDCRMPLLCAHAARHGLAPGQAAALMDAVTVDEGLRVLDAAGIREETMRDIVAAALAHIRRRAGDMNVGLAVFTNAHGLLGQTENMPALLSRIREEAE
ncbi:cobalt-precorrin-5B (C(1))-methyltransferase CbiD [Eubacteriales bacterium OttesenSCG-928-A19]|nr:cobalt-precorrin-5B (C(1))-methyltransferase CbiD [Eubacteriales bacterium OttesenSCG-928-A19]